MFLIFIAMHTLAHCAATPTAPEHSCACPEYRRILPQAPAEALQELLRKYPPHTPEKHQEIFAQLRTYEIPPEDWPTLYAKPALIIPPDPLALLHPEKISLRLALHELLSSHHLQEENAWPIIAALSAQCLYHTPRNPYNLLAADTQGPDTQETVCSLAVTHHDIELAEFSLDHTDNPYSCITLPNVWRIPAIALATTKTMLNVFSAYLSFSWRRPSSDETLLHMSMLATHCPCVTQEYLKKIDPNTTNKFGDTALHYLVQQCQYYKPEEEKRCLRKLELLCSSALDVNSKNGSRKRAAQLCEEKISYREKKIKHGHPVTPEESFTLALLHTVRNRILAESGWRRSPGGRTSRRYSRS